MTAPSAAAPTKKSDPAPAATAAAAGEPARAGGAQPPPADKSGAVVSSHAAAMTNPQLLRWMFKFLAPVKPLVALACFYLASYVGLELLAVRQTGQAIDHIKLLAVSGKAPEVGVWTWFWSGEGHPLSWAALGTTLIERRPDIPLRDIVLVLAALIAFYLLLRYLREVSNSKLSMTMVFYIREAVYDKLQRVGFGFHDAISSGQLINRALTDLQHVRAFIQTAVLTSLEIILVVGGYIIVVYTRNPWLALLSLIPLPVWTGYILRFSRQVQPANKEVMEAGDKDVSIITENIAGVHVVKAFATEKHEIQKYNANADSYYGKVIHRIRMFANFTPVVRAIATASYLSLFWAAAVLMIQGKLDAGDFVILGSAMGAILTRLQQVATINEQYQNAIVSARRLYEVLMAPATVPEAPAARPLPPGPGAVRFADVSFGYAADKPVLHDINFDVAGGSVVAIVGPTGAGKSTLVNLIARFYDPRTGRVTIDDVDVRDATLASLRTQVAFVFQETYLFSDTVAANIAYGRPGITHGEIEAAARLAQAHEFIEQMPKGYDTVLAERGSSLSGGQKQRLAIARAILTNPRILILDDATAAVDPETEDMIRKAMRFVMYGRTTFVIAHRISTVKRADLVLVVEGGRITQMGTHDKLMAEQGHYREIAGVQLYGDEAIADRSEHPSHMQRIQDPREIARARLRDERDGGGMGGAASGAGPGGAGAHGGRARDAATDGATSGGVE
ncbi:MAG TPA: ABC transporter ATP-binding protein [Tepidisphaeraceae bacterium]|nr:ABC transporter ATP-binding protein [Tepidisphaeraceae bacterium]